MANANWAAQRAQLVYVCGALVFSVEHLSCSASSSMCHCVCRGEFLMPSLVRSLLFFVFFLFRLSCLRDIFLALVNRHTDIHRYQ